MMTDLQNLSLAAIRQQATIAVACCCGSLLALYTTVAWAEESTSKRIEVYPLTHSYRDVQYGDTLSEIVMQLLPHNPSARARLQQQIVHDNPHAFIDNDASRMLANRRLWLPANVKLADAPADAATMDVEYYSWGNIKRPRSDYNRPRSANDTTSSPTTK